MSRGRKKRSSVVSKPTPEQAMQFMHDALVLNRIHFGYEWQGWRMAGRYLVSPEGDRICANRLLWLMRREGMREKLFKQVEVRDASNVVQFVPRRNTA